MPKGACYPRKLRDGTTVFDCTFDSPPPPGKRRQQTRFTVRGTKREADIELAKRLSDAWGSSVVADANLTLDAFLDDWLTQYGKRRKPATLIAAEQVVRLHIRPHLGDVKLTKLTSRHVERWIDARHDAGVSPSYLRGMLSVLRSALKYAVTMDLVVRNVADPVEVPGPTPEPVGQSWTVEETRTFLASERERVDFPLWVLAGNAQLRRGEVLGLRWDDLDADRGILTIRRQLRRTKGQGMVAAEPKTPKSRRVLPLAAPVLAILARHKERQGARKAEMTDLGMWDADHDGWIFDRGDGGPMTVWTIDRRFRNACARAGVPAIRLHDLRHTGITLLGESGAHPWVVQERAGHTEAQTTRGYSHPSMDAQRRAAESLAELLGLADDEPKDEPKAAD
jgi:integrase